MTTDFIIALYGGIGSGKSVVSRILRAIGYKVYDCDTEAKRIMDNSPAIKEFLVRRISPEAVREDGVIDRSIVSKVVFSDSEALNDLNHTVHGAVAEDFLQWSELHRGIKFIETAILYQSGLNEYVDEVWEVSAPAEIRIERVISRNNCLRSDVIRRIEAQDSYRPEKTHPYSFQIINDGFSPILPQIEELLNRHIK